ncbi:MAG: hypothetical protein AUK44_00580 [Porphyromonadaceae bacterium CG2_30_38_12]|nr:MAG: hypothetical protein AUK44_00580 [Porphyromonadaceae bacterium CG2_30_38_12]
MKSKLTQKLLAVILLIFVFASCKSGYNAYKKGDYFQAAVESVAMLKKSPTSDKAAYVLSKTYPLAQQTALREIENAKLSNTPNNYESIVSKYENLNNLAENIYHCPKALEIISKPAEYQTELADARQQAASQVYDLGLKAYNIGTFSEARNAYQYFTRVNKYVYGYQDVLTLLEDARYKATLRVMFEKPVIGLRYQLSADFFSSNIITDISKYFENRLIRFYNYESKGNNTAIKPHQYLVLNFEDFSIGNVRDSKNSIDLKRDSVKVGSATIEGKKVDVYNTVTAKLITYRREILSRGILSVRIYDENNSLIEQRNFSGQYVWQTNWANFNGDERALNAEQKKMCKQSQPLLPPSEQDLFVQFTKPIYSQAFGYIRQFYNKY